MNVFTFLNPGSWLAIGAGLAVAYGGLMWWGHTKYEAGKTDQIHLYEIAAAKAEGEAESKRKQQFKQVDRALEKADERNKARDVALARSKDKLATLELVADELSKQLADRGEAPAQPGEACGPERERSRELEGLLGQGARRIGACNRILVEGEEGYRRAADKAQLASEFIDALTAGQ